MPVIKGVLADDKLEQEAIRQQKWIERMEREEIVERMTRGALMKPGVSSISASAQAQKREHCKSKKEPRMTGVTTTRTFWYDIDSKEYGNFSKPVVLPSFNGVEEVDPTLYSNAGRTRPIHEFIWWCICTKRTSQLIVISFTISKESPRHP